MRARMSGRTPGAYFYGMSLDVTPLSPRSYMAATCQE